MKNILVSVMTLLFAATALAGGTVPPPPAPQDKHVARAVEDSRRYGDGKDVYVEVFFKGYGTDSFGPGDAVYMAFQVGPNTRTRLLTQYLTERSAFLSAKEAILISLYAGSNDEKGAWLSDFATKNYDRLTLQDLSDLGYAVPKSFRIFSEGRRKAIWRLWEKKKADIKAGRAHASVTPVDTGVTTH